MSIEQNKGYRIKLEIADGFVKLTPACSDIYFVTMSNRKENIKKTLGISEYPWSSDDDDDTALGAAQKVCSMLQHNLPAPRPSVADMPGTSGAGPSTSSAQPRLAVASTNSQQSRAQSKIDRDLFWSLINSPRGRSSPLDSSRPRIPDIRNMSRTNHTPAAELREAAKERPSSVADIRRIMAFKKLTRSFSSRPSKTALNMCVPRSASSSNMRRNLFSQSEATEIVANIRASRAKRLQAHNNIVNTCRNNLNLLMQSSSPGLAGPSRLSRAGPARTDYTRSGPAVTVDQSDEEGDIFSSTRMDGLTNEENNETRDHVEEQQNSSAGRVSLEEEIVEIEADPVIHIEDQQTTEQPDEANHSIEVSNTTASENQQQHKRRRIGHDDEEESCTVSELNQRLLRVLECPVCLEWAGAPVAQCRRGHVVCADCRKRLAACPVCRAVFSSVRNRAAEAVAELLRYPCRYGCGRSLRWRRRGAHEASCPARRYACPACAAGAPLSHADLAAHLHSKHSSQIKEGRSHKFSMRFNTEQHSHWFIVALQELFHLRVDVDINTWGVIIYVAYMGPKCKAKNYSYEVSVTGQDYSRRFSYTRSTHSDLEDSSLNVKRQDCFHLTFDQAMNFLRVKNRHCDPDKLIEFNVEISNAPAELKHDSDS